MTPGIAENAITKLVASDGIAIRTGAPALTATLGNITESLAVTDRNPRAVGTITRNPSPPTV